MNHNMNYFHKMVCKKGTFLLVGTTKQANEFFGEYQRKNSDPSAKLDPFYLGGIQTLDQADLTGIDKVRLL